MSFDPPASLSQECVDPQISTGVTHLAQGEYEQAIALWQQAVTTEPEQVLYYWYLGLALLLQGQESEAQLTWMGPLLAAEPDQAQQWIAELTQILQTEADRQAVSTSYDKAWLIRQHLRELNPNHLNNLLQVLLLELQLDEFSIDGEVLEQAIEAIGQIDLPNGQPANGQLDQLLAELLLKVIQQLLELAPGHEAVLRLIKACSPHLPKQRLIEVLLTKAKTLFLSPNVKAGVELSKICLELAPDDLELLMVVIPVLQGTVEGDDIWLSIRLAEQCLAQMPTTTDKILASQHLLTGLMTTGGQWQRARAVYEHHQSLLVSLTQPESALDPTSGELVRLLTAGIFCPYFEDKPELNRPIRNQIATLAQARLPAYSGCSPYVYPPRGTHLLRVGYLSESLRRHSVGWLIRWLLKHHNSDRVEVHLYSTRETGDPLQQALLKEFGDRFHQTNGLVHQVADQIYQDQIDVLVEVDSLTSFTDCAIAALKPAPVQVNWLGFDASGLPAIDYFIADPYVLPESAQAYYSEQIWRLPHTYIAVDGFEVSVPSLRRDQLGIPTDAIVYLSSQTGLKRNVANVQLQMQILKAVPNSYFLVKSLKSDQTSIEDFFGEIAETAGVSRDRLRFLPRVDSEAVHRGNLGIADVVLDTFPYTGATTTLETLWMGIPIVTRVGEQFAARNSYTMLMNVGVTEGIAWTDEEYIEWGIRLGQDETLRQQISWRLKRSRQTSPLWNAKQFASEMETAYEQMWARLG
jgi:predicted O-linked N-acetylglucosamine transferase (SPINDLY family)